MIEVHLAAYVGLERVLLTLFELKYDISSKDTKDRTPFYYAASQRHVAAVE
jgi:hypothetical protein